MSRMKSTILRLLHAPRQLQPHQRRLLPTQFKPPERIGDQLKVRPEKLDPRPQSQVYSADIDIGALQGTQYAVKFIPLIDDGTDGVDSMYTEMVLLTYLCSFHGMAHNIACPITFGVARNGESLAERTRSNEPLLYFALATPRYTTAVQFFAEQQARRATATGVSDDTYQFYDHVTLLFLGRVLINLMAVHAQGVAHLDVKLENIVVNVVSRDKIETRLIDFGLSRANNDALRTQSFDAAVRTVDEQLNASAAEMPVADVARDFRVVREIMDTTRRAGFAWLFELESVEEQRAFMHRQRYSVYPDITVTTSTAWTSPFSLATARDLYAVGIMYLRLAYPAFVRMVQTKQVLTKSTVEEFIATKIPIEPVDRPRVLPQSVVRGMMLLDRPFDVSDALSGVVERLVATEREWQ